MPAGGNRAGNIAALTTIDKRPGRSAPVPSGHRPRYRCSFGPPAPRHRALRLTTPAALMRLSSRPGTITALGITQTLAWASSYYLPAVLSVPMAQGLGIGVPTVFAAFSVALLVSALLGPCAGRAIDRLGGRPVLMVTNLIFALGLAGLACVQSTFQLFVAWALLGAGMGAGLYEAAFASLVRLYGTASRAGIAGVTLIAGFASTVGWPISTILETHLGWRGACLVWAVLHLAVALPLNALLPAPPERKQTGRAVAGDGVAACAVATTLKPPGLAAAAHRAGAVSRTSMLLALAFAITAFISTALAAHLPQLLMAAGASSAAAVAAGALMGPAQVGARLLEFGFLRRWRPLTPARLAALSHPAGAALLLAFGAPLASAFVVLHGAGNGILTIARGTLPLMLLGPHGYGARQGAIVIPARIAQALAPWLFGLCIDHWGAGALWVSTALGIFGFLALLSLNNETSTP